jgi:hypothetical protein
VRDAFTPNNSHFVPFHEYSAYRACAEIIGRLGLTRPRVADLGAAAVSRLSVVAPRLELVRDAYDCAIAVDALEERSPAERDALIDTAARARHAVVIAGRFSEDGHGSLPALDPTVARLRDRGFTVALSSNGHTPWVVPLTELLRRSLDRPGVPRADVGPLLADANRRFAPLDYLEPAVRRVVVAVRGVDLPALPSPDVDAYREAARQSAEWWSAASSLFDRGPRVVAPS